MIFKKLTDYFETRKRLQNEIIELESESVALSEVIKDKNLVMERLNRDIAYNTRQVERLETKIAALGVQLK